MEEGKKSFAPPETPVLVECIKCGWRYPSDRMVWEPRNGTGPRWRCATPSCDGVGYGYDIFYADDQGKGELASMAASLRRIADALVRVEAAIQKGPETRTTIDDIEASHGLIG